MKKGQSLSQGHHPLIYQQSRKGFLHFIIHRLIYTTYCYNLGIGWRRSSFRTDVKCFQYKHIEVSAKRAHRSCYENLEFIFYFFVLLIYVNKCKHQKYFSS